MTNVNVKRNLFLVLVFLTLQPIFTHQQQNEIDWWQNAVIYQIYPRSYQDSNNDGIGDLKGVTSRLSHLSEMGVKATWLSPIFKSPMVDIGYDISDFLQIQEEYGNMEDFQEMINEADRLGIKILLDLVPNHSSDQCEWFKKSVAREPGYEDFYVWADGKIDKDGNRVPPNNWQSIFYGSAWTWNDVRQQFYLHQFAIEQPDLNYRNPSVVEAMDNVILFWLDKGVTGFRVDAVCHLFEVEDLLDEPISGKTNDSKSYDYTLHYYTKDLPEVYELIQHWRELLDEYTNDMGGPTRIMMTEAYANLTSTMKYYEDDSGRKGSHFPFNFLMITDLNNQSNARDFVFNIQKWITYMPKGYTSNWVLGNHDVSRVASRFNPQLVDAIHILVMTLPGVVITYYGEEIGMVDLKNISWEDTKDPPALKVGPGKYQQFSRDPVRTPYQWDGTKNAGFSTADETWLPIHPEYETLNLAIQKEASRSHYKLYKKLIQLRESPVFQRGFLTIDALSRNVLAVKRHLKGQPTIVSVINVSSNEEVVNLKLLGDLPNKLTVLAASSESLYEEGTMVTSDHLVMIRFDGVILQGLQSISDERRELIKTIIKSANIILVGLLMYKLWDNKWTKLNFNKAAKF